MGTSTSAAEMSRKITKMATVTQQRQKQTVSQGALTAKEIIIAEAASKGVMPNSKIAGGSWSVRYNVKGFNNPTAFLKIGGAFHLVESDTKPHRINRRVARAKGRGSKRANRQQALNEAFGGQGAFKGGSLKFPSGDFRKVVSHPGTKGKHIFRSAKTKAGKAVPIVMSQRLVGGWREALR